ncbi:MAG: hypothetical protein U1F43_05960 [Myxococcota bacterium]
MSGAIGVIAGVVATLGFVPYAVAIVRGRTIPSRASWLIWTVVGSALAAGHLASGGAGSVWVPLGYCAGPLVTLALAVKYGEGGTSRFDIVCLAAAALSLGVWALTGDPVVALGVNIAIDLFGALPTIRKTWRRPGSEDRLAWSLFGLGNILNLFAVSDLASAEGVYPIYLVLISSIVLALIVVPRAAPAEPEVGDVRGA